MTKKMLLVNEEYSLGPSLTWAGPDPVTVDSLNYLTRIIQDEYEPSQGFLRPLVFNSLVHRLEAQIVVDDETTPESSDGVVY